MYKKYFREAYNDPSWLEPIRKGVASSLLKTLSSVKPGDEGDINSLRDEVSKDFANEISQAVYMVFGSSKGKEILRGSGQEKSLAGSFLEQIANNLAF